MILVGGIGLLVAARMAQVPGVGKYHDEGHKAGSRLHSHWEKLDRGRVARNFIGRQPSTTILSHSNTAQDIVDYFDLDGIQFGNWMNEAYRAGHAIATAQSLQDLSKILKVPRKKIGKNLSIALGARGRSRASAHYEPARRVINMTKYKGAGAFAHEFGHFIDNLIVKTDQFASGGRSTRMETNTDFLKKKGSLSYHFEMLFDILYFTTKGEPTSYYKKQKDATNYYRMRTEVFARTFEIYVHIRKIELGITNRYLQDGPGWRTPPIPLVKKARPHIEAIIKAYFK